MKNTSPNENFDVKSRYLWLWFMLDLILSIFAYFSYCTFQLSILVFVLFNIY